MPPDPVASSDADLLSRFLANSDPTAFPELLRRHGPMVLGICRRVLPNASDAEDAFQATFLVLAMRAGSIRDPHMLPAWLWSVARQTALKVKESARRRHSAEHHAAEWIAMTHENPAERTSDPDLQPILDRELDRLAPRHRAPVVMCYVEGISNRDAARLLGLPLGTFVSRLHEARQILRRRLARLGYGAEPESLPRELSQSLAPVIVPEALLSMTSSAVSHLNTTGAAATASLQIAKTVVKLMAYTKAKSAVAAALILLLFSGGAATLVYHLVHAPTTESASTPAPRALLPTGPTMWPSPPQSRPAYTGGPITGYVRTADGRPVAGAVVAYGSEDQPAIELFHTLWGQSDHQTRTGSDGHFRLLPTEPPNALFARAGDSFGQIPIAEISPSADIVLRPLGRIEGVAKSGSKPAASARILLSYVIHNGNNQRWMEQGPEVMTDADGRFTFEGIIPGKVDLALTLADSGGGARAPVEVMSGSTATVTIGGGGRTVVGRFTPALAAERRDVHLSDTPPEVIRKIFESGKTAEERKALIAEARRQPDVDRFYTAPHWVVAHVEADGSFRCEDVQPGKYTLSATWMTMPDTLATTKTDVVVPASSTGGDDALNLGAFPLDIAPRLKVGETVPDLAGVTPDGKPVKITDYRGKFLLYFVLNPNVVTWLEVTKAMAIRDRFRTDDRFRMATFYYPVIAQSARPDLLDWPVASMGEYRDQLPPVYRFTFARIILIDPEGRFVANSINAPGIVEAVEAALRAPTSADPAMGKIDITHREAGASPEGLADSPSAINLAATSTFAVADGVPTRTANAFSRLTDGKLASNDDAPSQNFFFEVGTLEGRLKLDLGKSIALDQVETYSRHKGSRAPQLYTLYASDGSAPNFDPSPKIGTDPAAHGWTRIATVDTRPKSGPVGGSYVVKISNNPAALGTFRYLLFEMFPTETQDPFGHTFFSEIRVLEHR